jgi:hypothetical protein
MTFSTMYLVSLCRVSRILQRYDEYRHAECHYAECHCAECHYAECYGDPRAESQANQYAFI